MEKLLAYLNSLKKSEQEAFAAKAGTTAGYLRKACHAKQEIGPAYCTGIEIASCGKVTRQDLRPDDWHLIWPELEKAA